MKLPPRSFASRNSLPPEGPLRLLPGKAGPAAPAGKGHVPHLLSSYSLFLWKRG